MSPDLDRGHLLTEQANPASGELDLLSTADLVQLFCEEDRRPQQAVAAAAPALAQAVDAIASRLQAGGRLFYVGAGTSGRLGVLDADELARVEQAMARQSSALPEDSTLSGLLSPETISIPLAAKTRSSVIRSMCELAATTGLLWDVDRMTDAVREREEMLTTALDCGAALLHPRRPLPSILAQPLLSLGITTRGIPFGGNGPLTDVFWLICSTDETTHLKILARISRIQSLPGFLDEIRNAASPERVYQIACDHERELD